MGTCPRWLSRAASAACTLPFASRWEMQVRGRNGVEVDRGGAAPELLLSSSSWVPLPDSLSFRMPFAGLRFSLENFVPDHLLGGASASEELTDGPEMPIPL